MVGFVSPMYLVVTEVSDKLIICDFWDFLRDSGLEYDNYIPTTVSYISKVLNDSEKEILKNDGKL